MKLRHFSISQQGDSHIKDSKNCQDYSGSVYIRNENLKVEMVVAAIADGVGTADYSEFGSQIAVKTVLSMLSKELPLLQELSEKPVLQLIKRSFQQANENIESEADKRELPFLLFDTTLTVAVLVEDGSCYVGHIGDDGIVALFTDGTYSMITCRIEGEEANSVIPLSTKNCWTFGVTKKPVAALALMTDGLLDKSVGSTRMNNRVFYPFFKPMFENVMDTDQDEIDLLNYWKDYLSEKQFRADYGVTDDITLAVVQIPSVLKKVHPLPFDEKKWSDESQQTREEIEEALSSSSPNTTTQVEIKPSSSNPPVIENTPTTDSTPTKAISSKQIPGNPMTTNNPVSRNKPIPANTQQNTASMPSGTTGIHSAKNTGSNISTLNSSGNIPVSNPPQKGFQKKITSIIIPIVALVCIVGAAVLSGKIGYERGVKDGIQQEQIASQQKLSTLQQEHSVALQAEYDRGKHDGIQEMLSVPTETPAITNTPQPQIIAPEQFVISQGQKGAAVLTIQERLIAKGWHIKADGDYGKNTAKAVREFQYANQLPVTGEVDILTYWTLLYDESTTKESPEPNSGGTTPAPPSEENPIDESEPPENVQSEEDDEDKSVKDAQSTPTPFLWGAFNGI